MSTTTVNYDSITNSNAITITLASLATSATRVAGRNCTIIDNTTTKYNDIEIKGQITTGTSPTNNELIQVWLYAPLKVVASAFSYPIATATQLTESDAAATFELAQRQGLYRAVSIAVNATSNRAYPILPFSVVAVMGLTAPPMKVGVFVTHSTGVNLNATAGNHWLHWTGLKGNIA